MSKTSTQPISQSVKDEVRLLRSSVIGMMGKDEEGTYKPSFVERALQAAKDKPTHTFIDKEEFLRHIG